MRVLITGVAGFVGGHMVDFLRDQHPKTRHRFARRSPGSARTG
jgi:nucleoside-diphosphate-sugar epimerase